MFNYELKEECIIKDSNKMKSSVIWIKKENHLYSEIFFDNGLVIQSKIYKDKVIVNSNKQLKQLNERYEGFIQMEIVENLGL